ncbi:MAG: outer membrane beta-barrel protein [Acidobacteria bacterium]|nr:outer membrane beta-barrel protein [Acidobacteriota bacterium]
MMRPFLATAIAAALLGGVARAQAPAIPPTASSPSAAQASSRAALSERYVEVLGGWTFGEKGSQFFGGELGFPVKPDLRVFFEAGRMNDAGSFAIREAARQLEDGLSQVSSGVAVQAEQPTFFLGGGLRYAVPLQGSRVRPFVSAGAGLARVEQKTTVMVNGRDVTDALEELRVVLGTDLSGSFTRAHVTLGGGLEIVVHDRAFAGISYRFMRIFAEDSGISVNRAGLGFGFRF